LEPRLEFQVFTLRITSNTIDVPLVYIFDN